MRRMGAVLGFDYGDWLRLKPGIEGEGVGGGEDCRMDTGVQEDGLSSWSLDVLYVLL